MRRVDLDMITPDMRLAKSIYHRNGMMLAAGTENLGRFIQNLIKLGIYFIYIDDEAGEGIEIPDVVTAETRQKCKAALNTTFTKLKTEGTLHVHNISSHITDMLDEIVSNPHVLVSLNDIGATDDGTLVHSVNTAVYTMMLANKLGYKTLEIRILAEGALLHDIGKILLDPAILFKTEALTVEEFEHIKTHPVLSYEILSMSSCLHEISKQIALHHHERLDGSGYPSQYIDNQINKYIRLFSITDVYEALIAKRCYRNSLPTYDAVSILLEEGANRLDTDMLQVFLQSIAIYPNGTFVQLSDNTRGIIKEQNQAMPFRPVVRIIEKKNGIYIPVGEIDLMEELNITIINAIN